MSHCTTHHPECCNVTMMSKAYAMLLTDLFDKNFAGGGGGGRKLSPVPRVSTERREEFLTRTHIWFKASLLLLTSPL